MAHAQAQMQGGLVGLQSQIWRNNLHSIFLLFAFPALLLGMLWVGTVAMSMASYEGLTFNQHMANAWPLFWQCFPWVSIGVTVWFVLAWLFYQTIIDIATGAKVANPDDANYQRAARLLDGICRIRGVYPVPALKVINSPVMNAYASGLSKKSFSIAVTTGLMEALNDDELEGVLAHELTHILNRDVRLVIVSIIFVGMLGMLAEIGIRMLPHLLGGSGNRRSSNGKDAQGKLIVALIAVVVICVGYVFAQLMRFSLSRKREYLADAGAADITKKPAALASALEKISGNAKLDVSESMQAMMIENPVKGFIGLFSTHPPVEKRIAQLRHWV